MAPDRGSFTVLSPHLDDAALSSWTRIKEASDPEVITVFSASPPPGTTTRWDRIAGATDSAQIMRDRVAEDSRAMAALGARFRHLDFLENQYRAGDGAITRLGADAPTEDALLKEIGYVKQGGRIAAPMGLGGHADHVLIRNLGLTLARHGAQLELYADIPYAARYGWPSWVTNDQADPHLDQDADWQFYLKELHGCKSATLQPQIRELTEPERLEKLNLVETYQTQFSSLNSGPIDRLRNPHTLRFEVFWRVRFR